MTPVWLEPTAPRSRVKHSTTEPLRSPFIPMKSTINNAASASETILEESEGSYHNKIKQNKITGQLSMPA